MNTQIEIAIIIGHFDKGISEKAIDNIFAEMKLLLKTAGGKVLGCFFQRRNSPHKKFLLGEGKLREITNFIKIHDVTMTVAINPVSSIQQSNLERILKTKVIDRTRLILDVFSLHAKSKKGKLQIELAQLLYNLPRIRGKGLVLSRLGGGIGTRGPGETKLESDRRKIYRRITSIKRKLKKIDIENREIIDKKKESWTPVVTLSGYTSSGKTTLFNKLTDENKYVNKQPFSTLVPVLRRLNLGNIRIGHFCYLSDTVGFIRDMPEQLMESFYSTLAEIKESDLILNVIDITDDDKTEKSLSVKKIFAELGIEKSKIINVYNKIDLIQNLKPDFFHTENENIAQVYLSAKEGRGIEELKISIFRKLFSDYKRYNVKFKSSLKIPVNLRKWSVTGRSHHFEDHIEIEIFTTEEKMVKFISQNPEVLYEIPS